MTTISRRRNRCPTFLTLDDIDVRGKRVLLRADLNVPVKDGVVTDATRIERLAPTIEALLGQGCGGRRDVAFRPAQGRARPEIVAAAGAGAAAPGIGRPRRRLCRGLHRRAPAERVVARPAAGAGGAARKPALSSGRGGKFARFRPGPGGAGRRLCRRRLFGGAPRARLDRRPRPSCCRPPPAS